MTTRVCFAILMLCYNLLTSAFYDGQTVPRRVQEVCQYTNFCQTDALQIEPNDTEDIPCCFPCYCNDDCWLFDDCCPDKDLNGPRPPTVPCIDSYVKPRFDDKNPYIGFYKVIDTCPTYETRSHLIHKCSWENRTSLEDFVWVSDITGRIYLNIYCAKCHGIEETLPWQIKTTCYDIMKATFDNFRKILLSENCNIINTIPEDLKTVTDRYNCIDPQKVIYSSCNETGLMASVAYDEEIACQRNTWPYVLGPYMAAKNVMCVMCNQDIPTYKLDGLCRNVFGMRDHVSSFTYLIDYASVSKNLPQEEHNSYCGLDEMFDEFMIISGFPLKRNSSVERLAQLLFSKYNFERLCRKLMCPIGTAPFYGSCEQLVSKIEGPVISVRYYLDVIQNQTSVFTDLEISTIGEAIFSSFIELLDLNSNCKHCFQTIHMAEKNSSSDFILTVTLRVKPGCHYSLVLKKLADIRNKVIEVVFNRTTILTLLVGSDKQPSAEGPVHIFWRFVDICWVVNTLSFDDLTCPRIDLNYAELETFSHLDKKGQDAFASFFIDNGTEKNVTRVPVCLDTYISVMSKMNSALPIYGKMTIQYLPAILYLLNINN